MNIHDLEDRLAAAQARLDAAVKALAPKHKGGEIEEWEAAHQELLGIERELAATKGEQYAVNIEFPARWDAGAPCPQLVTNDAHALLVFYLRVDDPNWDGSSVKVRDEKTDHQPIGLVTFSDCYSAKLGAPNDEVFEGHPLDGHGLEAYGAQEVINSHWILEIKKINSVHRCYDADSWHGLHHYIFWFHDSTFECIARGFEFETLHSKMPDVLSIACGRLLK